MWKQAGSLPLVLTLYICNMAKFMSIIYLINKLYYMYICGGYMKKIFKSLGFTALFFIAHNLVQTGLSLLMVFVSVFFDLFTGTLQITENRTFLYKGSELSNEDINIIYGSKASIPGIILTAIFMIFIYWLIFKMLNKSFAKYINFRKTDIIKNVSGFLCGAAIYFPVTFIISITFIKDLSPEATEAMEMVMKNTPFLLQILGVGIFAPIIEEVTFRGLIFSSLKKSMSLSLAIVIQAVLFGILHMNLQQFIYASVLGILFALLVEWTGSISASILAHMGFNITSILTSNLFENLKTINAPDELLSVIYILLLMLGAFLSSIAIFYLYWSGKKRHSPHSVK